MALNKERQAELGEVCRLLRAEKLDVERACKILDYAGIRKRPDCPYYTHDPPDANEDICWALIKLCYELKRDLGMDLENHVRLSGCRPAADQL